MDYGRVTFADDLSLFLFGTPGQRRFEVMWEILSEGMIGFVLLVNLVDERSLQEAVHILEQFRRYADVPFVVGATHADEMEQGDDFESEVRSALDLPPEVLVRRCDPRSREDVKTLMLEILVGVLRRLDSRALAG
jgi:signal recognition particle receptor subunit beta